MAESLPPTLGVPATTTSSMLDIPGQYLTGTTRDGIMTGPTSARTSRTRVDYVSTHPGSVADAENYSLEGDQPDEPQVDQVPEAPPEPQTSVTFLLISGRRRTMSFQPELTVGRVKELVWNSWPTGKSPFLLW